MSEIASGDMIRAVIGGVVCAIGLYGLDRTILFHASLFRSEFSGNKPDTLFKTRPRVLTNAFKTIALVITTAAFSLTLLDDGNSYATIVVAVVGFLAFTGMSLADTLRQLQKLQRGE